MGLLGKPACGGMGSQRANGEVAGRRHPKAAAGFSCLPGDLGSRVSLQKHCTKLHADLERVRTGRLQLKHQFLCDLSCKAQFPCCFSMRCAEPAGPVPPVPSEPCLALPPWDNLRVTHSARLSLNTPNYQQILSFPMGTTQGPEASLMFCPTYLLLAPAPSTQHPEPFEELPAPGVCPPSPH